MSLKIQDCTPLCRSSLKLHDLALRDDPVGQSRSRILPVFQRSLVRNGQFLSTFSPARSQHPPAVCRCHSLAEPVLVLSLSFGRLIGTYHKIQILPLKLGGAKMPTIFLIYNLPPDSLESLAIN